MPHGFRAIWLGIGVGVVSAWPAIASAGGTEVIERRGHNELTPSRAVGTSSGGPSGCAVFALRGAISGRGSAVRAAPAIAWAVAGSIGDHDTPAAQASKRVRFGIAKRDLKGQG